MNTQMPEESPELIRQRIELTKSALTDKLVELEGRVRESFQDARHTVEENVEMVREFFHIRDHIRARPLLTFALAVTAGFLIARRRTSSFERREHF